LQKAERERKEKWTSGELWQLSVGVAIIKAYQYTSLLKSIPLLSSNPRGAFHKIPAARWKVFERSSGNRPSVTAAISGDVLLLLGRW